MLLVALFAFGAGWVTLRTCGGAGDRPGEAMLVTLSAGLGATAVILGVLGLAGHLDWARYVLGAGAAATVIVALAWRRRWPTFTWSRPRPAAWIVIAMTAGAAAGAIAPVTEFDSLAYPLPIAHHLAKDGAWTFWPDQVRSVFPLSQMLLLVPQIQMGGTTLGLMSALEFMLAAGLIVALGRRVTRDPDAPWIAAAITLGCPAVAFLAASAKEDLLLLTMTTAAAVSLVSPAGAGAAARVGLFAGFAAGAKFTGLPLAAVAVLAVPFCCGRDRPLPRLLLAIAVAGVAGGLWYGVNLARFGTPVPIASLGPWFAPPILPPDVLTDWANGFGVERGVLDFAMAPFRMALGAEAFGGRGNWINVLPFLGLAAVVLRGARRGMWPLVAMAAAGYVAWFSQIQVARLLLPVLALLSIPAADLLMGLTRRQRWVTAPLAAILVISAGVVAVVGGMRAARYVAAPETFLARETPYYDEITWMNTHLDPSRDRVASFYEANGYLGVPWASMNATYQTVVGAAVLDERPALPAALKRAGFTHVFGPPAVLADFGDQIEIVHLNASSVVGGSRFFRAPETAPAAVARLR